MSQQLRLAVHRYRLPPPSIVRLFCINSICLISQPAQESLTLPPPSNALQPLGQVQVPVLATSTYINQSHQVARPSTADRLINAPHCPRPPPPPTASAWQAAPQLIHGFFQATAPEQGTPTTPLLPQPPAAPQRHVTPGSVANMEARPTSQPRPPTTNATPVPARPPLPNPHTATPPVPPPQSTPASKPLNPPRKQPRTTLDQGVHSYRPHTSSTNHRRISCGRAVG